MAKRESRSLASVVPDLIRSARTTVAPTAPDRGVTHWELPVVNGARPFTVAEVDWPVFSQPCSRNPQVMAANPLTLGRKLAILEPT